jgi:hypothetical protein
MTTLETVEQGTILRATVGSTVHGLHHGGQDDRDELAVFIEPPEYLIGLRLARKQGVRNPYRFEHWVERTQPEGARSGPGELDLVAYSLRKYVRLALKGHPTVLLLLFVPDELTLIETELGRRLRQLRPAIVCKRAGRGYLGYLRGQKERLLGTRGQKRVNRPELVEAHGFDTKYARCAHSPRLPGPRAPADRAGDAADAGARALTRAVGPARRALLRRGGRGDRRSRAAARSRARADRASG